MFNDENLSQAEMDAIERQSDNHHEAVATLLASALGVVVTSLAKTGKAKARRAANREANAEASDAVKAAFSSEAVASRAKFKALNPDLFPAAPAPVKAPVAEWTPGWVLNSRTGVATWTMTRSTPGWDVTVRHLTFSEVFGSLLDPSGPATGPRIGGERAENTAECQRLTARLTGASCAAEESIDPNDRVAARLRHLAADDKARHEGFVKCPADEASHVRVTVTVKRLVNGVEKPDTIFSETVLLPNLGKLVLPVGKVSRTYLRASLRTSIHLHTPFDRHFRQEVEASKLHLADMRSARKPCAGDARLVYSRAVTPDDGFDAYVTGRDASAVDDMVDETWQASRYVSAPEAEDESVTFTARNGKRVSLPNNANSRRLERRAAQARFAGLADEVTAEECARTGLVPVVAFSTTRRPGTVCGVGAHGPVLSLNTVESTVRRDTVETVSWKTWKPSRKTAPVSFGVDGADRLAAPTPAVLAITGGFRKRAACAFGNNGGRVETTVARKEHAEIAARNLRRVRESLDVVAAPEGPRNDTPTAIRWRQASERRALTAASRRVATEIATDRTRPIVPTVLAKGTDKVLAEALATVSYILKTEPSERDGSLDVTGAIGTGSLAGPDAAQRKRLLFALIRAHLAPETGVNAKTGEALAPTSQESKAHLLACAMLDLKAARVAAYATK